MTSTLELENLRSSDTLPPKVVGAPRVPLTHGGPLAIVDQLLRDRTAFLACIEKEADLTTVAKTMIITSAIGAASFGASIGAYRGGLQILFAAVKLPLVVLLTAGLATPALSALGRVLGGRASLRRDIVLVLSSLALGSLVIAALAPVVWLASELGSSYHRMVLLAVSCCAIGGVMGLSLFIRGLREREVGGKKLTGMIALAVIAFVGMQMTWTMRPYILRPRTENIPFVRMREGSFLDSVSRSIDSARGIYYRGEAPVPYEESSR